GGARLAAEAPRRGTGALLERGDRGSVGARARAVRAVASSRSARGRPALERVPPVHGHPVARPRHGEAAEAAGAEHRVRIRSPASGAAARRAYARGTLGVRSHQGRDRRAGVAEGDRMSDIPKTVKIKEVGPREGFQFEKGAIGLADKISLVDAL